MVMTMSRISRKQKHRIINYFENLLHSISYDYFKGYPGVENLIQEYIKDHTLPIGIIDIKTQYAFDIIMIDVSVDGPEILPFAIIKNKTEKGFELRYVNPDSKIGVHVI